MMKKICGDRSSDDSSLFSAEAVGNNEHLLRQIFLHLPVRSLIRFNIVSKLWFSVITDAQFLRDRNQQLNPTSGLFFSDNGEIESVSLDDSPIELSRVSFLNTEARGAEVTILQSCNGLLFLQFKSKFGDKYCVCNPTTKNYKILPELQRENASGYTLAFDPSISPHYRVVCQSYYPCIGNRFIEIYSSKTGKWNNFTSCSSQLDYGELESCGFYWNGGLGQFDSGIFSYEYDIEKGCFNVFHILSNTQTLLYFGESRGHLHLVYFQDCVANKLQVLERDRETLIWSEMYCVDICDLVPKFPEICIKRFNSTNYAFFIISVDKDEKGDTALMLATPGKIISYNFHFKTSKVLSELPSLRYRCYTFFKFIESLASV